jgi:uncharacterized membrane protein
MKSKLLGSIVLVFGIFFVVVGLILYFPANDTVEKYDSYGIISDIGKALDPDLEKEYTSAKTMSTIGMIAFIVGLLLTVAGIVFVATGKDA